jgi:hypothetical protein
MNMLMAFATVIFTLQLGQSVRNDTCASMLLLTFCRILFFRLKFRVNVIDQLLNDVFHKVDFGGNIAPAIEINDWLLVW